MEDDEEDTFFDEDDDESNLTTFELEEQVWELEKSAREAEHLDDEDDDIF